MNKKELIEAVSAKLDNNNIRYPKWELTSIIEPVLEVILEALSRGEEVQLNKFGRFFIRHKKGSPYYNINTGQKEIAPNKRIVQFTPHKGFRFDDMPDTSEPASATEDRAEDKKEQ